MRRKDGGLTGLYLNQYNIYSKKFTMSGGMVKFL